MLTNEVIERESVHLYRCVLQGICGREPCLMLQPLSCSYRAICFTVDDSDKVEVKDQPAKNETVDLHVQAGDTVQQQGMYNCYASATFR